MKTDSKGRKINFDHKILKLQKTVKSFFVLQHFLFVTKSSFLKQTQSLILHIVHSGSLNYLNCIDFHRSNHKLKLFIY